MNQRSMRAPRRIDTRAHRQADNAYRRRPHRRSFDAFELGAFVALAIGATLMVAIWMRWL